MLVNFCLPLDEELINLANTCLQTRQARNIHSVPELKTHGKVFRENGIPPFLSLEAYRLAWRDYQGMLVEKLNRLTFGMTLQLIHKPYHTAKIFLLLRYRRRWHSSTRPHLQIRSRCLPCSNLQLRLNGRQQPLLL